MAFTAAYQSRNSVVLGQQLYWLVRVWMGQLPCQPGPRRAITRVWGSPVSHVLVHVMTTAGVSAGVLKAGQGSAQGGASGEQAVRGTDGEVRPSIRCLQCRCLGHYRNKCPYLPRAPYGGYGAAQGAARMPSVPKRTSV